MAKPLITRIDRYLFRQLLLARRQEVDGPVWPVLNRTAGILALDEALTAFSQVAPRQAKVVELRYFGGLTEEEIVAVLKISPRRRTRLGSRQGMAAAGVKPYHRKAVGIIDMTVERFRQIAELYHAAREGTASERAAFHEPARPDL